MATQIQLDNVSRTFQTEAGEFAALKPTTIGVDSGEFLVVVGKSGSGKTTFLNLITGIDRPTSGTIHINQTGLNDLTEGGMARFRGETIGIVFQFFQLMPTLTALENVVLAMDLVNRVPRENRMTTAKSLLDRVGLERQANKLPSGLSGGEQQRVAIARSLANDPAILVADEPTGNLDSETSGKIYEILAQCVADGKTVILVTHEHVDPQKYPRIIKLSDGGVVSDSKQTRL